MRNQPRKPPKTPFDLHSRQRAANAVEFKAGAYAYRLNSCQATDALDGLVKEHGLVMRLRKDADNGVTLAIEGQRPPECG